MILKTIIHQVPCLRFTIPYISGVCTFLLKFKGSSIFVIILISILLLIFVSNSINRVFSSFKKRWVFGLLIFLAFYLTGYLNTCYYYKPLNDSYLNKKFTCKVVLVSPIEEKPNSFKAIGKVYGTAGNIGKALMYFEKNENTAKLDIGDHLLINTRLTEIKNQNNPNEFDYKKYLSGKGIFVQAYIAENDYMLLENEKTKSVYFYAHHIRKNLLNKINNYGLTGDEFQVVSALVLGYKNELSPSVKHSYAASGAMHILAVSGLHVGIIYFVFASLLNFIFRKRKYAWINTFILLIIIWAYAVITGISPSVQRASVMFSFIIIGKSVNRPVSIYHSIFMSAFVLLLINPFNLTDIGFQLSYMAVLGIVYLFPKFYNLFTVKYLIIDKIWALTCVSIAAQIATLPITLYYFHQFPVYFLVANIFVIPLATLILYCGLLLISLSFWPGLASVFGVILSLLVKGLNFIVFYIENMRFALIEEILFTKIHLIILYLVIILFLLYLAYNRAFYIKGILAAILIMLMYNCYNSYRFDNQNKVLVYNIKGKSVYNFIIGRNSYIFCKDTCLLEMQEFEYSIKPGLLYSGIKADNVKFINTGNFAEFDKILTVNTLDDKNKIFVFKDKRLLLAQENNPFILNFLANNKIDYIILSSDIKFALDTFKDFNNLPVIILDSSNSFSSIETWEKKCINQQIIYHSVRKEGAFSLIL